MPNARGGSDDNDRTDDQIGGPTTPVAGVGGVDGGGVPSTPERAKPVVASAGEIIVCCAFHGCRKRRRVSGRGRGSVPRCPSCQALVYVCKRHVDCVSASKLCNVCHEERKRREPVIVPAAVTPRATFDKC